MKARTFVSQVLNVEDIAPEIRKICLSFPSDFSFDAGQYISIKIPSQNPIRRSYSIFSNPSDKGNIEICFKRILNGPGTSFLSSLKPNDKVEFFGPLGSFKIDMNLVRKNLICISAGTGVVPFRSIILNLLGEKFDKNIILLSGHKDKESAINYKEFRELESKFSNFKYYPALSNCNKEHVQDLVKKVVKKEFDGDFYLCGMLEMIEEVVKILNKMGFEEDRIHLESYN